MDSPLVVTGAKGVFGDKKSALQWTVNGHKVTVKCSNNLNTIIVINTSSNTVEGAVYCPIKDATDTLRGTLKNPEWRLQRTAKKIQVHDANHQWFSLALTLG